MAEPIQEDYRMDIREVQGGRYLQKFFTWIMEDGEEGCTFTEEEYFRRKAQGQL